MLLSEMLSELASKIVFHRLDFMKQLEALAIPIHDQLSLGREKFSVSYQATIPLEDGLTPSQMKKSISINSRRIKLVRRIKPQR